MLNLRIIFLLLFTTILYAKPLSINDKTEFYDLLPHTQIYIDKSKSLTLKDIQKKDNEFKDNDKKLLGYGYSPDFNVWVKFTLENNTNKTVDKILEYDNTLVNKIIFFNPKDTYSEIKSDSMNILKNRTSVNPIFHISLKPEETLIYYIQCSSRATSLNIKLNLWNNKEYNNKELKHQIILSLFFGAMSILFLYNLFIYFFTKDKAYLYYVSYILGVIWHQLLFVGFAQAHILNNTTTILSFKLAVFSVSFPLFSVTLFTRVFLNTKQFKRLDKVLYSYLFIAPIVSVLSYDNIVFNSNIVAIYLPLFILLFFIGIYSLMKGNKEAKLYVLGWSSIVICWILMALYGFGLFDLYKYFPYIVEFALLFEAIIFSIALANRIKILQKDKDEANEKLITQQVNEKQRLEIKVDEKTKDLKIALDEKGLLLKELNHRVKNNMQTIVSLIRLQGDKIEDEKLHDIFQTAQNRINAMSHLHELLYKQDNISNINAYEYFEVLVEELRYSYDNEVHINFDIQTELKMEQAIYCGLILNELISNSLKHAFPDGIGDIYVSLTLSNNIYTLSICDNGIGYNKDKPSNSLGLILVNTLSEKQLRGKINIDSSNGVNVTINWSSYD